MTKLTYDNLMKANAVISLAKNALTDAYRTFGRLTKCIGNQKKNQNVAYLRSAIFRKYMVRNAKNLNAIYDHAASVAADITAMSCMSTEKLYSIAVTKLNRMRGDSSKCDIYKNKALDYLIELDTAFEHWLWQDISEDTFIKVIVDIDMAIMEPEFSREHNAQAAFRY